MKNSLLAIFLFHHLLTGQSRNTGQLLAFEKLERRAATSRDVGDLVLDLILGGHGSGVTTANDHNGAGLSSLDSGIKGLLGTLSEGLELEDTRRAVPKDSLSLGDSLLVEFDTLRTNIQTHEAIGNTGGVSSRADGGVSGELVGSDIVDGEDDLNVVLLSLLDDLADDLATGLVKETVSNFNVLKGLLEGKGHPAGDDEAIDLGQEVINQLNLVRHLGTTKNGKEGACWVLQGLGEVLQLLLHEETGSLLREVHTDHGAVGAVGGTERIICKDVRNTRAPQYPTEPGCYILT